MTALNKTDRPMKRFQVRYMTSSIIGHTHKIIVEAATAKEAKEQVIAKCIENPVKIIGVTDLGRTVKELVDELETKGKVQVSLPELKVLKQIYKERNLDITITVKKKSGT
ncbi:MAG TPA: hypothetical protein GXX63_12115 [Tissierellia bacterium]|nr:hypothetical protein [Tissierellia bacterium]